MMIATPCRWSDWISTGRHDRVLIKLARLGSLSVSEAGPPRIELEAAVASDYHAGPAPGAPTKSGNCRLRTLPCADRDQLGNHSLSDLAGTRASVGRSQMTSWPPASSI